MRNIRKLIKSHDLQVTVYDRVAKEERTEVHTVSEIDNKPKLPENCIVVEQKIVEGTEREILYIMSPSDFVKHATLVELDKEELDNVEPNEQGYIDTDMAEEQSNKKAKK